MLNVIFAFGQKLGWPYTFLKITMCPKGKCNLNRQVSQQDWSPSYLFDICSQVLNRRMWASHIRSVRPKVLSANVVVWPSSVNSWVLANSEMVSLVILLINREICKQNDFHNVSNWIDGDTMFWKLREIELTASNIYNVFSTPNTHWTPQRASVLCESPSEPSAWFPSGRPVECGA